MSQKARLTPKQVRPPQGLTQAAITEKSSLPTSKSVRRMPRPKKAAPKIEQPPPESKKIELRMMTQNDIDTVSRQIERYIRTRRVNLEKMMFERFYHMRIEQSRRFIDLIEKITSSCDDFVELLQLVGSKAAYGDGDYANGGVIPLTQTSSSVQNCSIYDNFRDMAED